MSTSAHIHSSSIIDANVIIGIGTNIWHLCHIQSNAEIGDNCVIGQNVNIGSNVVIGNGCKIQNNVSIYEGVMLENFVFCGPSCVFTNDLTPRAKYPKGKQNYIKTLVQEGATIGANATVVCGHRIGKHAMIGAGAVITSDVKDYALMLGVPARFSGWVCECGCKLSKSLRCLECNKEYHMDGENLKCNSEI